jgi:hypothetical protein
MSLSNDDSTNNQNMKVRGISAIPIKTAIFDGVLTKNGTMTKNRIGVNTKIKLFI